MKTRRVRRPRLNCPLPGSISWLKRFIDNDSRYEQFLCPLSRPSLTIEEYRGNCPVWQDARAKVPSGPSDRPADHCWRTP